MSVYKGLASVCKTYQLPFLFLEVYSLRLLAYKYLLRLVNPSPQCQLGKNHLHTGFLVDPESWFLSFPSDLVLPTLLRCTDLRNPKDTGHHSP